MAIRVLLLCGSPAVGERLRNIMRRHSDIELIDEADDSCSALPMLSRLAVDVVVMDLSQARINALEIAARILAVKPFARVVIVSLQSDPHYVREVFRAGVAGYLLTDCAFEELAEAVRTAAAGGSFVSPEIEISQS